MKTRSDRRYRKGTTRAILSSALCAPYVVYNVTRSEVRGHTANAVVFHFALIVAERREPDGIRCVGSAGEPLVEDGLHLLKCGHGGMPALFVCDSNIGDDAVAVLGDGKGGEHAVGVPGDVVRSRSPSRYIENLSVATHSTDHVKNGGSR
jgi:hypothetical protein